MATRGESGKALRVAHFASVSGDTLSDLALFVCAPFLAILVEAYLDLPEKAALILLSLAFIAAVVGKPVAKGFIGAGAWLAGRFYRHRRRFLPAPDGWPGRLLPAAFRWSP